MKWTHNAPRVKGWFWIRSDDERTEVVEVKETIYGGDLRLCVMIPGRSGLIEATPADSGWDASVQFAGPVPEPS